MNIHQGVSNMSARVEDVSVNVMALRIIYQTYQHTRPITGVKPVICGCLARIN